MLAEAIILFEDQYPLASSLVLGQMSEIPVFMLAVGQRLLSVPRSCPQVFNPWPPSLTTWQLTWLRLPGEYLLLLLISFKGSLQ